MEGVSLEVQREMEERLRALLESQPWWRRYANTVTAAVTNLVLLAWLLVSSGIDLPHSVQWAVAAVLFAGNVLGIRGTSNGVTPSLIGLVTGQVPEGRHHR